MQEAIACPIIQIAEATLVAKPTDQARFFALPYVISMLITGTPAPKQVVSDLKKAAKIYGCSPDSLELPNKLDEVSW